VEIDTSIEPIDYLVLNGFQQRFQQVFGAVKCAYINANDKTKILQRLFGDEPLSYPYATFEVRRVEENDTSYNPHRFLRRGLVLDVASDTEIRTVRVLPTNFEIDIEYTTNKFQSIDQGSVMAFCRRWLLARRLGYLKTSINYGRHQFGIGVTLDPGIDTPSRENVVENETSYRIQCKAVIHGYTSEPALSHQGKVTQFNVNGQVGGVKGQIVSTQFFAFPEKS
jgi:hypothetical protein